MRLSFFVISLMMLLFLTTSCALGQKKPCSTAFLAKHYSQAFKECSALSAEGDPQATEYLAHIVKYGKGGTPVDKAKAKELYRLAFQQMQRKAEEGDVRAQYQLGFIYSGANVPNNYDVQPDPKLAEYWTKRAMAGGGTHFSDEPLIVEKTPGGSTAYYSKEGDERLLQIALSGEYPSGGWDVMQDIAYMYETGRHTQRNYVQAYKWYILGFYGNGGRNTCARRNALAKQMAQEHIQEAKEQAIELRKRWGKSTRDKCVTYKQLDH